MSLLPSQVARIDLRIEVAVGADLDADQSTWTWTDITEDLDSQSITVTRGATSEASEVEPSNATFRLNNSSGRYTPDDPRTDWWPDFDDGTPVRITLPTGTALRLDGLTARASTPDDPALDITGDWTLGFEFLGRINIPPADLHCEVAGKYNIVGNQRSILVFISAGLPSVSWSTDGLSSGVTNSESPVDLPFAAKAFYAHLDVDNGGGGWTVTFWAGESLAAIRANPSAHLLGTDSDTGTTSVFASSAPLEIGDVTNFSFPPYAGRLTRAEVRSGDLNGTVVANPNFSAQTSGVTSFTDGAGRLWSMADGAEITDRTTVLIGQISSILPTWPYGDLSNDDQPGEAQVTITVSGLLRRIQRIEQPIDSTLYRRITSPEVAPQIVAYWPWEDDRGAASISSPIAGVTPLTFGGAIELASDSTLDSSRPLPTVSGGQGYGWKAIVPSRNLTDWRIDQYVYIASPAVGPADETLLFEAATTGTVRRWTLSVNDDAVILAGYDADDVAIPAASTGVVSIPGDFGRWVRWGLNFKQNGANVDWQFTWFWVGETAFSGSGSVAGTVGRLTSLGVLDTAPPNGISFGQTIVSSGLGFGWLEDTADTSGAGAAFDGEFAGDRIERLCIEEGVPVRAADFNLFTEKVGPQPIATFYEALLEAAQVDGGILEELYDTIGLSYRMRRWLYNQTALVLDAGSSEIANPFEPQRDDVPRRNVIKAIRRGGSYAVATTTPPPKPLDSFKVDVTLNAHDDNQLERQAAWRLHLGTWRGMRYPSLTVDLTVAPHIIDHVLSLRLGDRVQVTNLPPQHPVDVVDLLIKGWTLTATPTRLTVTFNCAPAGPWAAGIFADEVRGKADTAGSELTQAVDADDTALAVAVTAGPLWTIDDAQFPFDCTLGGEVVTATDVAPSTITFVAAGTPAHGNNASVFPSVPAGTQAGDLLLILAAIRNNGSGRPVAPAGWTEIAGGDIVPGLVDNVKVFAKIATSSESGPTVTFVNGIANADTSAQMAAFRGRFQNPSNLVRAATAAFSTSAQDIEFPPIHGSDISEPGCLVLYTGWKKDDWTSVAPPAGSTEIGEPDTTTGDDQGITWSYLIQTTASPVAAGSFVVTGGVAATVSARVLVIRQDLQTWTVTRAVNGITKTHAAGSSIQLTEPMRVVL